MKRFALVIDREGISVSIWRGRRLAIWFAPGLRRSVGTFDIFTPREGWLDGRDATTNSRGRVAGEEAS